MHFPNMWKRSGSSDDLDVDRATIKNFHHTGKRSASSDDLDQKTAAKPTTRPKSKAFRYHSYYKDTIAVQRRHNYVNDDEEHEENPRLKEFLVPHHSGDVEQPREGSRGPTITRPPKSILHDGDCPSRHSREITESKQRISFHQVTVRDYDMTLGDHPNVSYGPPISLGWHYHEYEPLDLNEYEYHHARRRPLRQLGLNYYRRMSILEADNTADELKKAAKEVNRTKMKRTISKTLSPCWKIFYALEIVVRKVKRKVKKERPLKQWDSEDELDWSVHSKNKSILKKNK